MKTKPFNLELALQGHPVVTRDGEPVTDLTIFTNANIQTYSLAGILNDEIDTFTKKGKYVANGKSGEDLFLDVSKPWTPPFKPKMGDEIEVRNSLGTPYIKRVFVGMKNNKCVCASKDEGLFDGGINLFGWKYARPIQKEININIKVTVNDEEVCPSTLSEETWANLRPKKH